MKLKKIAGITGAILAVLFIVLLCIFLFWLGPTVKVVAQRIGSKALGTPLTIGELAINPRHGTFHMTGFAIANHDVFGRSNTVALANMEIAIDMGSIFTPTVIVHKVQIDSPHFVYEQSSASDNITEYVRNIEEYLGVSPTEPKEPEKDIEEEDTKPKTKVIIVEQLEINDIQFHLANTGATHLDIDVGIEQIAVSMTNGTVVLKNLHVGNPALLETPNLFTLAGIAIEVDPASIYSGKVAIRDIQVTRPYAYLEHNPQTDTVAEFMKIAETFARSPTHGAEESTIILAGDAEPEEPTAVAPPFDLYNLLVDDIQIKLLDSTKTNALAEPKMLAGIGAISVKLAEGRIQLKGISVPNPEGFVATNLFQLDTINITLDPASIFSPQTVIQEILVDTPTIYLEQTETTGNASTLTDTLMGFVPPVPESEGAPTPEVAASTGKGPKPTPLSEQPVVLQSLIVTNFSISLALPVTTNQPASGLLHIAAIDEAKEKVSASKLNPMNLATGKATNHSESAQASLKLISIDRIGVAPLDGTVQIANLRVANPKGFANKHLATIEQFSLELDPDTLQSDTLLIRKILIKKPGIAYERQLSTDNIKTLQTEIEKAVARRKGYAGKVQEPKAGSPAGETESSQKVIIEHILVSSGMVRAKISALPTTPIPLPKIELKDLGKEEGGTSISQAMSKIGGAFYDAIIGAVANTTGFASDALKGAGALTLGTLGNITGLSSGTSQEPTTAEDSLADDPETPTNVMQPEEQRSKRRKRLINRRPGRVF